jgi:hypothetical protein
MRQTASPDSGRSLGNPYLDLRHKDFRLKSPLNLDGIRGFEKQSQGFNQVIARLFNRRTLADDIVLRAQRDIAVVLSLNDCRETP